MWDIVFGWLNLAEQWRPPPNMKFIHDIKMNYKCHYLTCLRSLSSLTVLMQATWRLKEEDAERLVRAAVARSERPWLILLTLLSGASAVLLAVVLWQVQRLPQ